MDSGSSVDSTLEMASQPAPDDTPPPDIPPDAQHVMFNFPATFCERYDPALLSLDRISCSPLVRVCSDERGRHVFATECIPPGIPLGWYEGSVVEKPNLLLNLHPYAMSKGDDDDPDAPLVIGSSVSWTSYVDHTTGLGCNIGIKVGKRPSSVAAPRGDYSWPYMYSLRCIPAGEELLFNYDSGKCTNDQKGFLIHAAERRRVFQRLADLIRSKPYQRVRQVFKDLEFGNHNSAQQNMWLPLFRALRPEDPDGLFDSTGDTCAIEAQALQEDLGRSKLRVRLGRPQPPLLAAAPLDAVPSAALSGKRKPARWPQDTGMPTVDEQRVPSLDEEENGSLALTTSHDSFTQPVRDPLQEQSPIVKQPRFAMPVNAAITSHSIAPHLIGSQADSDPRDSLKHGGEAPCVENVTKALTFDGPSSTILRSTQAPSPGSCLVNDGLGDVTIPTLQP